MAGKTKVSYELPVDVETAYAAISSEGWAEAKRARFSDDSRVVSREVGAGDAVTLVVSRKMPDGVPGFLQKFMPSDGRVTQTDVWGPVADGVRSGTWIADTPGSPAKVDGSMSLAPSAGGCTYTVAANVKVSIPLIGGKAESFVLGMTEKLTAKEAEVLKDMVS